METIEGVRKCRLCLCDDDQLISIFDISGRHGFMAADVISEILHLEVGEADKYPPYVCNYCFDKLTELKHFKIQCYNSKVIYDHGLVAKVCKMKRRPRRDSPSPESAEKNAGRRRSGRKRKRKNYAVEQNAEEEELAVERRRGREHMESLQDSSHEDGVAYSDNNTDFVQPDEKEDTDASEHEAESMEDGHLDAGDNESLNESITIEEMPIKAERIEAEEQFEEQLAVNEGVDEDMFRETSNSYNTVMRQEEDPMLMERQVEVGVGEDDAFVLNANNTNGLVGNSFGKKKFMTQRVVCRGMKILMKGRVECPVCGRSLASNSALEIHYRTHTGERPFSCLYCPKTFTRKFEKLNHETTHLKKNKCDICEMEFSDRKVFVKHRNSHYKNRRIYSCDACKQVIGTWYKYQQHLKTLKCMRKRAEAMDSTLNVS